MNDTKYNQAIKQIKQRIYWFQKKYLFEKMCAVDFFLKLALVCISYHCRAWYAFHTIAEWNEYTTRLP